LVDDLKIRDKIEAEPLELESGRHYEENLQTLGRSLIASLYMLIRNVRLYDPENEVFGKPLQQLMSCVNTIIQSDGQLLLQGAGNTFYLNNMLLKFDSRSFENVRQLSAEFEVHDVGGFELDKLVTVKELQDFIFLFKTEGEKIDEHSAAARKLKSLKVSRFGKIREILKSKKEQGKAPIRRQDIKLDRKRYAMLLYGRTVQFMRKYVAGMRGLGPRIPRQKAHHLIQDQVDIVMDKRKNFLGMTTATDPWDGFCFHTVSVATLAVVFGSVLRLRRDQLRTLGMAALFHDIGRVTTEALLVEAPADDTETRAPIQAATVRHLVATSPMNNSSIHGILSAYDAHVDYGPTGGKGPHRFDLNLYGKIIALADCYDQLATFETTDTKVIMELMTTDLSAKFDPFLLKHFAATMTVWTAVSHGQKVELF